MYIRALLIDVYLEVDYICLLNDLKYFLFDFQLEGD